MLAVDAQDKEMKAVREKRGKRSCRGWWWREEGMRDGCMEGSWQGVVKGGQAAGFD